MIAGSLNRDYVKVTWLEEVYMLGVSAAWRAGFPEACAGVLVMEDVTNPPSSPDLDRRKLLVEEELRERFKDRDALRSDKTLRAYRDYYKKFKKTYHVLQQLESIIFKGKSIPKVAGLVEAMFMAELSDMLLTAGHDLDLLVRPITLDVAQGIEKYVGIGEAEQILKPGDMCISDSRGVLSSIIHGPDHRTKIRASTKTVLFTVYGVPGVEHAAMKRHLDQIESNVRVFPPRARVQTAEVCR